MLGDVTHERVAPSSEHGSPPFLFLPPLFLSSFSTHLVVASLAILSSPPKSKHFGVRN
jgi:hypothetical protein